jgi:4-hydroxymandelate oxidase
LSARLTVQVPHEFSLDDLERAAREVLPADLYEFIATGARSEQTVSANVSAWRSIWFVPRVLVDVSPVRTTTHVLGQSIDFPVMAAPMSVLGLVHPDGDIGLVRATAAAGTVAIVSQYSLTPLDQIAGVAGGRLWVQHYPLDDRGVDEAVVRAALAAGAGAIVVTVDFPLRGVTRARPRGGFTFPPDDRFPAGAARGHEPLTALTMDYFDWLRHVAGPRVPLVAKGVLHADDALRLADHGVAAVVVSNHGGRTLDGAIPTADALADVVAAVDQHMEVYVDGGIRSGADVLRALSLGARAVLVGRPLAWGLAYAGQRGVEHVLNVLRRELEEDSALAGVADTCAIPAGLARRRTSE